jgi:phosphopantetheine adenylyltransferase
MTFIVQENFPNGDERNTSIHFYIAKIRNIFQYFTQIFNKCKKTFTKNISFQYIIVFQEDISSSVEVINATSNGCSFVRGC